MSELHTTMPVSFAPERVFALAQRNMARWSRAYAEIARGVMAAEIAQIDLVRAMVDAVNWPGAVPGTNPQAASRDALDAAKARLETTTRGFRRINDALTESLFAAATTLVEDIGAELGTPDAAPPAAPPATPADFRAAAQRSAKVAV